MDFSKIMERLAPVAQHFEPSLLEHLDIIAEHTIPVSLKAGECFPKIGYEEYQTALIIEGAFRIYSVDERGKENTIRLSAEGEFTVFLEDYKKLNPHIEYRWEAVTDATLLTWSLEGMELLARTVPRWYTITIKIIHSIILQLAVERGEMFNDDATTRYLKFDQRYPHISARVPLRHIASYLGIAPQSLSRIRNLCPAKFNAERHFKIKQRDKQGQITTRQLRLFKETIGRKIAGGARAKALVPFGF
jgi:CRP-like cAMP-binding protein